MADEKNREQNQPNDQDRGKAMGAGAGAGFQGDQKNPDLNSQRNEMAGQGGGIQGQGQRQPNPGGYTEGENRQRDEIHKQDSTQRKEPGVE